MKGSLYIHKETGDKILVSHFYAGLSGTLNDMVFMDEDGCPLRDTFFTLSIYYRLGKIPSIQFTDLKNNTYKAVVFGKNIYFFDVKGGYFSQPIVVPVEHINKLYDKSRSYVLASKSQNLIVGFVF